MKFTLRSLAARLVLSFMLCILALWVVMLAAMLLDAAGASRARQQQELAVLARMAAHSLAPEAGSGGPGGKGLRFMELEKELRTVYYADCAGPIAFQVWKDGREIFNDKGLPQGLPTPGMQQLKVDGSTWLAATAEDSTGLVVRLATEDTLSFLVRKSNPTYVFLPLVISLPLLLIPVLIAVRIGLRPVREIIDAVRSRDSADLSPLPPARHSELEAMVGAINALMARLNERIGRERELLADAAHELKTPMAIIQANADNLLAAGDSSQRTAAHNGLVHGLRRGAHTVHQLLAYARSGANARDLKREEIDLSELLVERAAAFATLGLGRRIDVELECQPGVVLPLHRESVVHALDNILDNAVKYTQAGTTVFVKLSTSGNRATLEVADQGPGIAPELRARVFERFYRIPGSAASGSGLGLSIVARAVAHMEGSIVLGEAPGGGLSVRITLPLSQVSEHGTQAAGLAAV
ncbi:sensor histidine kinase [Massilia endophytica]|uniref:sensor histidine kinase n=1 Tax=Massilia endophytica TaxID=2899220 RepID=UPI001E3C3375|nr:HAMP domain-containing sensor histidine kinase [Massilia endophytica]UGQ45517.1 HAMP domain-containing histidine kinase [Massilia endophytica]